MLFQTADKSQALELMKTAQKFNRKMSRDRVNVFNSYYDDQTNVMMYPKDKKYRKVDPELTRFDDTYPVACLPGQYSSYYVKFTPEEKAYLPLGTCMKPGIMKDHKLRLRVAEAPEKDRFDLENLACGQ